jgi:hypothetical protein
VADILEQHVDATIHNWLGSVEEDQDLIRIPLNFKERTRHLPRLLHDVIARLRGGGEIIDFDYRWSSRKDAKGTRI